MDFCIRYQRCASYRSDRRVVHELTRTHLAKELVQHPLNLPFRAELLHPIRHQGLCILDQRALLPLPLIVPRGTLESAGERLDGREPLDPVFRTETLVARFVAVDGIEWDQWGE